MLSEYYWRRGMYMYSSGENEENEENESESSSADELIDCSDMSGDSSPAGYVECHTTHYIRQYLVESTNDIEGITH